MQDWAWDSKLERAHCSRAVRGAEGVGLVVFVVGWLRGERGLRGIWEGEGVRGWGPARRVDGMVVGVVGCWFFGSWGIWFFGSVDIW